jgi:hypothetical protein
MATNDIPESIKSLYRQPSADHVICVQVRRGDPPQHVADDIEDLLERSSRFWGGEQCDSCGCHSYVIERNPHFPSDLVQGWQVRCCGDADEAQRWQGEGAEPASVEAIRTGCGAVYNLRWEHEDRVCF